MSYVSELFDATLIAKLPADGVTLPISSDAKADLLALLEDTDNYTLMAIKSDQTYEVVRAKASGNSILITRALEGTAAVEHPMGACVALVSPLTLAAIKELVCNYDCCQGDCTCTEVSFVGALIPPATVGVEWQGAVLFNGDLPITIGIDDAPAWITGTVQNGMMKLTGTPTKAGAFTFSVAATNCNGTAVTSVPVTVDVSAGLQ